MSRKIENLREILFQQLDKLTNTNGKELEQEVSRSAAIVSVSQSIIETAKVETEFIKVVNEFQQNPSFGTGFIGAKDVKELSK